MSIEPLPSAGTMAALPLVSFMLKFNEATSGWALPVGYALRNPLSASGWVTVRLTEYAAAMGMPAQGPSGMGKEREVPACSFGPPYVPFAFRVSTTRHGSTATKDARPLMAAFGASLSEGTLQLRIAMRFWVAANSNG